MLRVAVYQAKPGGGPLTDAPGQACDQCLCTYVALPKRRGPIPRSKRLGLKAAPGANRSRAVARTSAPDNVNVTKAIDNFQHEGYEQIHIPTAAACPDRVHAIVESPAHSDTATTSSASLEDPYPIAFEESALEAGFGTSLFELGGTDLNTPSSYWPCPDGEPLQLPPCFFEPYLRLFVDRLYPIFPVIDCQRLMRVVQEGTQSGQPLPAADYALLTSLSAAVVVQLNLGGCSFASFPDPCPEGAQTILSDGSEQLPTSAQVFALHCLQARRTYSFIEEADEWTILTSFFLFAYYGNLDESRSAWYYLREAIGFAQSLGLDDAESYSNWDVETQQRRRRLFWLLFITERAYAIQQRRPAILRPCIDLPKVFEARDPKLIYGFVMLARVFKGIDSKFISAWMLPAPTGDAHDQSGTPTALLNQEDLTNCLSIVEVDETQRLDVLVTQQWLRALNLLQIVSRANTWSLEAHGIGMEQKISDAANCLCDFLSSFRRGGRSDPNLLGTPDLLHSFMVFLGRFRNHESRYLEPLVQKSSTILALGLKPSSLHTLEEIAENTVRRDTSQPEDVQEK
ncbi:GATA-type sexual development transcription factor NsdD [Purpureocillium lavendulum]|uniref:GATA-type sexual development transcription factor NsdD n=1 Tax=Purpureocillium lavendulum TaxID=1247861 RepID=A0AB34FPG4_9HYPO|nr:GATA-type sexual development transcription factor NsdD [Purpureocillium lavendulum]